MGWGRNPPPPPGAAPVDANGNPFENEHQAKCYAESAAKREARQAKRDARAQPPPSTEFAPADLFSDARPCALLMVQDRSKARKLATLLNDAVSSAAYFRRADLPKMGRGDAAAATWIFSGDESRRRRGRDVDIQRRRVAATPRPRRGYSVETSRGDAAAATWIFRGDESRRRCGCEVEFQ